MITVTRAESPLAHFYVQRQPWVAEATCRGVPKPFDEAIHGATPDVRALNLKEAREMCRCCTVRIPCCEQALVEEAGQEQRFGLRAWLTPAQRQAIERNGGLKGRDPMLLAQGWDGKRKVPPIPDSGLTWSRHHTTLARKVVKWLVLSTEIGGSLPPHAKMCTVFGCNPDPLARVLSALVQDGTLDCANGRTYTRRNTPRVIGWLPLHLR